MKVLFLTNIPSPYRVDFFNELGKMCDLTVLFESCSSKERNELWKNVDFKTFKGIFLTGIKVGNAEAFCPHVMTYIKKNNYNHIVVGIYSSPTGMLAIEYMKRKNISFVLSTDGGVIRKENIFKYKIKKYFISAAQLWLSTGAITTNYLCHYGAKQEKCYVYPFTSISEKNILKKPLTNDEKKIIRFNLGMNEERIILSVGQFIYRKGYDILLHACKDIRGDVGIYLIGGTPTKEYIDIINKYKLQNIHFIEFINKVELEKYYMAADLFVLPTREDIWGLVINEAMAYGLPVITSEFCNAGVELIGAYNIGRILQENKAKYLAESLNDKKNFDYNEILNIANEYTIEKMALKHIEILKRRLNENNI